jgi:ribosome-associated protein
MGIADAGQTPERPGLLRINDALSIPEDELRFRFSRSSGPGGQHVNRSETRVELLFDLAGSPSLTEAQRMTLQRRLGRQIDAEGTLRVVSSSTRSQLENRADAVARFQALLAGALVQRKRRVATRPSAAARARRLDQKRARGSTKAGRARVRDDSD